MRELEKTRANLMRAVEQGKFSDPIIDQLNKTDADLKAMQGKRAALVPVPVDLPQDLPELYREHVADLVETLSDELVAGRAGDELRTLIERVIVSWDADIRAHRLEVIGNLVGMLKRAKPAGEAGFVSNKSSLELVAGTRVGLCRNTIRLQP